jgi:hypothetical protein
VFLPASFQSPPAPKGKLLLFSPWPPSRDETKKK